ELAAWRASIDPDADAAVDGDRRVTWAQLTERTNQVANALTAMSIGRGDRVVYVGDACLEAFELFHAVPRIGALMVPLNDRLAITELARIVSVTEPRLIVHDASRTELAQELGSADEIPRAVIGDTPSAS